MVFGVQNELDLGRMSEKMIQRALNHTIQPIFQPLFGVRVSHADDQEAVFIGQRKGGLDPGIERGFGHLELELAQGGLPDLAGRKIPSERNRTIGK